MHFRTKSSEGFEKSVRLLEARPLDILDGAPRTQWQHGIPRTKELRDSRTMRTARARR